MTRLRRIGALLLVLAALVPEAGAAAGADPARRWVGVIADCQYERMTYLETVGETAGIAVVGSSLAFRGIHAAGVRRGLGDSGAAVINLATPMATTDPIRRWTMEALVPLTDPDVVVIAFLSRDVNPGGSKQDAFLDLFDASAGWTFTERGDLALALRRIEAGRRVPLYRAALRRPDLVTGPLREGWDPVAAGYRAPGWTMTELWPSNCNQISDNARRVYTGGGEPERQWIRENLLTPYDLAPGLVALRGLVRDLQSDGIAPVLVNLPATLVYQEAHPGGVDGHDAYRARIRRIAEREGVLLVDAVDMFRSEETLFSDTRHLNVKGANRLSRLLGRVLQDPDRARVVCVNC